MYLMTFTLFAQAGSDMETGHWVGLGGIALGVVTACSLLFVSWINNARRTQHQIGSLQDQAIALHKRITELTTRVFALQDDGAACKQREADLKMEVHALSIQMRLVQMSAGGPPSPIPGVVVCDMKGKVRIYSPSLVPMLGWLPKEVEGQPLDVLVPPDLVQQHRDAFARYAAMPNPPAERDLVTYALAKSGTRVPVTIHIKSLQPEGLITAEIRQRASADGK